MLKATQLSKRYGDLLALDNFDLEVAQGEIYCLLGANGAGKTTTVNLFMGFLEASSGGAYINGQQVVAGDARLRSLIAYIPENVVLYPELTGLENLDYLSRLSAKKYSKAQLQAFLNQAGLQTAAHPQKVVSYSKGMRQKVGIALALAKEAVVLFLDEPTSGLDPQASNEFSQLLQVLSKKGVTVFMVTHDLFRAKEVANRIGIMSKGQLVKELSASGVSHSELETIYLQAVSGTLRAGAVNS
jgi:ABC-2 type transport system ATP-binding protein